MMIVSSFVCQEVSSFAEQAQDIIVAYNTTLHHLFGYLIIDAMISQPHANDLHDTLGHLHLL